MKCPCCQQYSLTYDWLRNGWICHVYNGFIPDEHMPRRAAPPNPMEKLSDIIASILKQIAETIGVEPDWLDLAVMPRW